MKDSKTGVVSQSLNSSFTTSLNLKLWRSQNHFTVNSSNHKSKLSHELKPSNPPRPTNYQSTFIPFGCILLKLLLKPSDKSKYQFSVGHLHRTLSLSNNMPPKMKTLLKLSIFRVMEQKSQTIVNCVSIEFKLSTACKSLSIPSFQFHSNEA